MDLRQLLRTIRANALWAVVAFLACLFVGGAVAFLPAKQYQASTTVLVQPPPNSPNPENDVGVITAVLPQLPLEATNQQAQAAARALLPSDLRGVAVTLAAAFDPSSNTLTFSATSRDPVAAADYANAVVRVVARQQPAQAAYVLRQVAPATPPSSPVSQKKTILVAAVGFGIILAVFAALAAAGIRRRFSNVEELRERLGATVLGQIPRLRSQGEATGLFVGDSQPKAMEAFLELRSNILLSPRASERMSIAVTSIDPSEGKTSIVANLAWVLAASGRSVTAVDCDLRNPSLHLRLGVPFGPGLAGGPAVLVGRPPASPTANLDVIPTGIPDRHPADVVSAFLPPLLEQLRERDRTVVVDCPPINGAAETVLIGAMVDAVVVVVDGRRFNPDRLKQALGRLDMGDAEVIGVVLNRVRGPKRKLGRSGYGYYPYGGPTALTGVTSRGRGSRPPVTPGTGAGPGAPADPWVIGAEASTGDERRHANGSDRSGGGGDDRVVGPGVVTARTLSDPGAAPRDDEGAAPRQRHRAARPGAGAVTPGDYRAGE